MVRQPLESVYPQTLEGLRTRIHIMAPIYCPNQFIPCLSPIQMKPSMSSLSQLYKFLQLNITKGPIYILILFKDQIFRSNLFPAKQNKKVTVSVNLSTMVIQRLCKTRAN